MKKLSIVTVRFIEIAFLFENIHHSNSENELPSPSFFQSLANHTTAKSCIPAKIDLEKNEIRTGGEEIPLFSASVQHSKSCSVLAKKRTIIPARSECLIQGVPEVPGQFRYAVTDFPSQASQKGLLVAATLVDMEMEAIPVRVLNLNNKPKILDKGDVIATCEPVVDIVARPPEFSGAQHLPSTLENFQILNEEQRTAVRKLLNEFQNLFSTCDADVGRCNMTQHRINTGDHPPIKTFASCKEGRSRSSS
ncbi:hypothetical protein AVEN_69200-1 [Araneus ventricosus]|uniref:Peptidase A9 domain-containing protein n=1 Tax=Araneus ventricosus TaxID=182803 RepID=A0A4Y2TJ91_ARAVE|nr:hypothetical protein AVEN_69200-1 [Araneus ventricosus]